MSNDLANHEERFPMARTPGAQTLPEVFEQWQEWGLEPVEVSQEQLRQLITIEHNALTQELTWRVERADGAQALGILATAMWSMFQQFFKEKSRPRLTSGAARIAIQLDGDRLTVGLDRLDDPVVVKGAVAAALWELIDRSMAGDQAVGEWRRLFEFGT